MSENVSESSLKRIPFSKDDEQTLLALCGAMRVAAFANLIAALLNAVVSIAAGNWGGIVGVALQGAFAYLLIKSAAHFQKVAETDDDDQRHVAEGIDGLRVVFLIKGVIAILAMVLFVVMVPMMIFAGALMTASGS